MASGHVCRNNSVKYKAVDQITLQFTVATEYVRNKHIEWGMLERT